MRFKKGDRVIYTGKEDLLSPELLNKTGTIVVFDDDFGGVFVKFDDIRCKRNVLLGNIKLSDEDPRI